jgi:SpoVK/Ycf46/Vps4 family AAA+-type ATPase
VLADDVFLFESEATKYKEAGNLEETLSNTLLKGMTLQHLSMHAKPKDRTQWQEQLRTTEHALGQLHAKLQSKMDYFHGCLDSESDDEDGATKKLDCDSIRPIDVSSDNVSLASIVGNEAIKQDIINGIVQPFNQPLLFKMHRSFLFYGPPGTGKTMFAKASANSLHTLSPNMNVLFFAPTTDALKDKHVGGTEKKITNYFKCVQQQADEHTKETRVKTVGVIFIDEIDSLARSRDEDDSVGVQASATNTLLQMMDGFTLLNDVIVMAATNYPWQLDDAVLSRFQDKIYVRLPDTPTIIGLLKYNIMQFYTYALGMSPTTTTEHHYDVLASLCGIDNNVLSVLAKTFHSPTTYSPSNIKDVCQQVFRKSARQVHQHGIFYPVVVSVNSEGYRDLSKTEQTILSKINHTHASAVTYSKLKSRYPQLLANTKPINLRPSRQASSARPESITIGGEHYLYSGLWLSQHAKATQATNTTHTLVNDVSQLTQYHIYVQSNATGTGPVRYVLYKSFYALYGPESVSMFQMCGVGELAIADVLFIRQFMSSPVAMLQRVVEPLLRHTPSTLLLRRLHTLHFKDAKTAPKDPFWSVDVRQQKAKHVRRNLFDISQFHTEDTALDLQGVQAHTKSGVERLVLWSLNASNPSHKPDATKEMQLLVKIGCHKPKASTSTKLTVQLHHIQDASNLDSLRVQQSAFSLHIDTNMFADAINPEFHDAIRPTSNAKDVKRLEKYWRGD